MHLRVLGTAVAATLIVTLAPTAAHAAKKPTYKVTISTSATVADVGQTITVKGKVTGPKAAKKRILVQQRVGTSAWKTVRKVRTTAKRRYATTIKVRTAGAQQLRVVAPKNKKARKGTSKVRAFTGWRWIDATVTGALDDLTKGSVTIRGKAYAGVIVAPDGRGYLDVRFDKRCDSVQYGVGTTGTESSEAQLRVAQSIGANRANEIAWYEPYASGDAAPSFTTWRLHPDADHIWFVLDSSAATDTERAVLITPRLHCNVNSLPKAAAMG